MQKPVLIQFQRDCFNVLCSDLNAVFPDEGCALLIGEKAFERSLASSLIFRILLIWPCSNIFGNTMSGLNYKFQNFVEGSQEEGAKSNHFLLDPREQLHAQKWSRSRNLEILGSAHSHPFGETRPSNLDLYMVHSSQLMIIMNQRRDIQAWWLFDSQQALPEQVPHEITY
tara:strand:- start:457 stop:966 length:510 start_codon:yes stop_codon:yes gene_type:complete